MSRIPASDYLGQPFTSTHDPTQGGALTIDTGSNCQLSAGGGISVTDHVAGGFTDTVSANFNYGSGAGYVENPNGDVSVINTVVWRMANTDISVSLNALADLKWYACAPASDQECLFSSAHYRRSAVIVRRKNHGRVRSAICGTSTSPGAFFTKISSTPSAILTGPEKRVAPSIDRIAEAWAARRSAEAK